jgi:diphthamide synthase subunit DPH2
MKTSNDLPNYRCIKVKFIGPTATLGARIKLYETKRASHQRVDESITLVYDHQIANVLEQAIQWLDKNGFKPVCRAYDIENYYILCDNYGENYKKLNVCKK